MSTSLETRMPFLNKDLYEFLSNIPVSKKYYQINLNL